MHPMHSTVLSMLTKAEEPLRQKTLRATLLDDQSIQAERFSSVQTRFRNKLERLAIMFLHKNAGTLTPNGTP